MRRVSLLAGVMGLLVMVSVGEAVRPRGWVFATEKEFSKGSFEGTVVDSYGQLMLGRELSAVATGKENEIVTGLVESKGGAVFAAVNGDEGGKVYRIEGKKGTEVYAAPKDFEITAVAEDGQGNLLVALSGKAARVVRVKADGGKEAVVFENEAVDYVWAIAVRKDGRVFVGTGPQGKVYQVVDEKAGKEVLETPAKNVTALGFDKDDNLVAGTDGKGLVIRVDGKTGTGFVLLDSGKVDVNAIVRGKDGALFVATAKGEAQEREEEEPETKSKPGATEPEPVEPGDGDGKGKQGAAVRMVPGGLGGVLGVQDDLASALKKLADTGKGGPATKRKPGILHTQGSTTKNRAGDSKEQNGGGGEGEGEEGPTDASCVYRISAEGVVTTVMREGDMNYALALAGEDLLIGTGNEGKVYRYRAGDESVALVARVMQEHVTAILATKGGEVLLGTANMGQVYRLGAGTAKSGTFTSQVLDAGNTADWGHWSGHVAAPEGSKVTVATRSGNTRSVVGGSEKFWSPWSKESDIAGGKIEGKVSSPAAKYLQFRVTLTGDGKGASPVVNGMKLGYQAENLAPRIKKVAVETAGGGTEGDEASDEERSKDLEVPPTVAQVSWEASDSNGDTLVYRVFYRAAGKVEGKEDVWTPLAKGLKESVYEWDTRGVADGEYQVKVIASDKLDNATGEAKETARVSGTFVVDHTPPTLGELKVAVEGNKVTISGEAKDATSAVVDVRYRVDGQISGGGDWQPGAGSDKIFDSAQEAFTVVTGPLSVGGHRVMVRATDSQGNSSYKTVTVVVKP